LRTRQLLALADDRLLEQLLADQLADERQRGLGGLGANGVAPGDLVGGGRIRPAVDQQAPYLRAAPAHAEVRARVQMNEDRLAVDRLVDDAPRINPKSSGSHFPPKCSCESGFQPLKH